MLDLQAQPRTTSVTRGAPDQGDVGSDSPRDERQAPALCRRRRHPHLPRLPRTAEGPDGCPPTPTPDPRVSPGPVLGSRTPRVEKGK